MLHAEPSTHSGKPLVALWGSGEHFISRSISITTNRPTPFTHDCIGGRAQCHVSCKAVDWCLASCLVVLISICHVSVLLLLPARLLCLDPVQECQGKWLLLLLSEEGMISTAVGCAREASAAQHVIARHRLSEYSGLCLPYRSDPLASPCLFPPSHCQVSPMLCNVICVISRGSKNTSHTSHY